MSESQVSLYLNIKCEIYSKSISERKRERGRTINKFKVLTMG